MQQQQKRQTNTSSQLTLYTQTHTTQWDYDPEYFLKTNTGYNIPLSIFSGEQAPLQALVVYLRDYELLSFKEMAQLLSRAESTLRVTHANTKNKELRLVQEFLTTSVREFNTNLSVLEVAVHSLHAKGLRNVDVAAFLNKDPRTTSTVFSRAKQKKVMQYDA